MAFDSIAEAHEGLEDPRQSEADALVRFDGGRFFGRGDPDIYIVVDDVSHLADTARNAVVEQVIANNDDGPGSIDGFFALDPATDRISAYLSEAENAEFPDHLREAVHADGGRLALAHGDLGHVLDDGGAPRRDVVPALTQNEQTVISIDDAISRIAAARAEIEAEASRDDNGPDI